MRVTETIEAEAGAARWEDFVDIFYAPASVYRRRREDTAVPALLVLLGLALALSLAFLPLTRQVLESAMAAQETSIPAGAMTVMQIAGVIGGMVMMLVLVTIGAALLWIGTRLVDVDMPFGRAFLVATYAGFVLLLAQIAGAVLLAMHDGGAFDPVRDTSFGVLRFIDPESIGPAATAALARIEPFGIWQAVLWFIGVREVGRSAASHAAFVAIFAWAVMALPNLLIGIATGQPS
jgi:hypothetical protein